MADSTSVCETCAVPAQKKCTGCELVFYCSKACQKEDWKEHKVFCQLSEDIDSTEDTLYLVPSDGHAYAHNLDLCLEYGRKYLKNLKHLKVYVDNEDMQVVEMEYWHPAFQGRRFNCKFNNAALDELLQTRQLESIDIGFGEECLDHTSRITSSGRIYLSLREMSTLRRLALERAVFDSMTTLCDSLPSQLKVLCLDYLSRENGEDLTKDDCHAIALTVAGLRHLVYLSLVNCQLTDEDVDVLMQEKRVNLRKLHLGGFRGDNQQSSHLTDHSLRTISAACPYLQEVYFTNQHRMTANGVIEFMKASPHLRHARFAGMDIPVNVMEEALAHRSAGKLFVLCFGLFRQPVDEVGMSRLYETTGGRIMFSHPTEGVIEPDGLSETVRLAFEDASRTSDEAHEKTIDPSVCNEWNDWF